MSGSPDTRQESHIDIRAVGVGVETGLWEPNEKAWVSTGGIRQASHRRWHLIGTQSREGTEARNYELLPIRETLECQVKAFASVL